MTRILISAWFALGRLPFLGYRMLAGAFCVLLAVLLFALARERRRVALTNLSLCFPSAPVLVRIKWTVQHIYFYLRTFLDRAWLWSGDEVLIRGRVHIENPEALPSPSPEGATI
ncbi:MAG TPA: hypothetical protein VFV28_10685, partial [Limnobacter sp.]|nr:hypothetical protein [Limnobacter sp.]